MFLQSIKEVILLNNFNHLPIIENELSIISLLVSETFIQDYSKLKCKQSRQYEVFSNNEKAKKINDLQTIYKLSALDVPEQKEMIGKKISQEVAIEEVDISDKIFEEGEIILVLRSDSSFQYVVFKGINFSTGNIKFCIGDGNLYEKPITTVYKIKNPLDREKVNQSPPRRAVQDFPKLLLNNDINLPTDYMRTMCMKQALLQYPNYNIITNTLYFNSQSYIPISTYVKDFFFIPTASCGSSLLREVVTLNPSNSPILYGHLMKIMGLILLHQGNFGIYLGEEIIMQIVVKYVRENMFPSYSVNDLEQQVDAIVAKNRVSDVFYGVVVNEFKIPFIPIDTFLSHGLGVCRHHAMATAYILDGLAKNISFITSKPFLSGIVQHMRDTVPDGAHAWVTYVSKTQRLHIDTLWNIITDFSDPVGQNKLKLKYGDETINRQLRKTDITKNFLIQSDSRI